MWNNFVYENDTYIIKINSSSNYNVVLSNFVNIWTEELSEENIVDRCKNLNPLITTDNETYIQTVLSICKGDLNSADIKMNKNDNSLILEYKTKVANTLFKFNFNLKLNSNLTLCKEIIVPTIHTIQYLEKREKQLCELLKKKDEEIQQHIFENGDIKRKTLTTNKFDQDHFNQSTSKVLCCNLFSKEEFSKTLISNYGCAEPELLNVKKEEKKTVKNKVPFAKQILSAKRRKKITNLKVEQILKQE